jgi:ATP-dependent RNA helicase RhlE
VFLKKINSNLNLSLSESSLTKANILQKETFSLIKSGADLVISSPDESGKSTTIVLNVIQRLVEPFEHSPRALIIVENRERVMEMVEIFEAFNKYNDLRVSYTYEQTNLDDDKNKISIGIDVLIGTPKRLGEMFSGAGFDINRLKMFVIDDTDYILKSRHEQIITRLSDAIEKTQRIFMSTTITDKIEVLADKLMSNPTFVEMDEEDQQEA